VFGKLSYAGKTISRCTSLRVLPVAGTLVLSKKRAIIWTIPPRAEATCPSPFNEPTSAPTATGGLLDDSRQLGPHWAHYARSFPFSAISSPRSFFRLSFPLLSSSSPSLLFSLSFALALFSFPRLFFFFSFPFFSFLFFLPSCSRVRPRGFDGPRGGFPDRRGPTEGASHACLGHEPRPSDLLKISSALVHRPSRLPSHVVGPNRPTVVAATSTTRGSIVPVSFFACVPPSCLSFLPGECRRCRWETSTEQRVSAWRCEWNFSPQRDSLSKIIIGDYRKYRDERMCNTRCNVRQ